VCVGYTPLIEASWMGHLSIVEHLVEHKANIEAKSNIIGMFLDSASAVLFSLYVFCLNTFCGC
jgi:ankyrin repeat protein